MSASYCWLLETDLLGSGILKTAYAVSIDVVRLIDTAIAVTDCRVLKATA
jgi:hypothetical protein